MNKTKKKNTHRYRDETSGYQWEDGRGRDSIGLGGEKRFLWDYMKSSTVKILKIVKHYRIERIFL